MHRIAEGLELPGDWGFFTNVGMTLDTTTPLFGLGSAKYNAASIQYAKAPLLPAWGSYYIWTGKHFKMSNVASATPNWIFGWRSESTPGSIVEGGCVGVKNSHLCFALGGGPTPTVIRTGKKLLANDTIYNLQMELWFSKAFGWVKLKLNNVFSPDLIFNGITATGSETFLSQVWMGSLYGGGNGNCWVDDFLLNDQQQFKKSDYGPTGMVIVRSVATSGQGAYGEWTDDAGDQVNTDELTPVVIGLLEGVAGTSIVPNNVKLGTIPLIVTVYGPITNPVFQNLTTSETISFTGVVPSGSRLTVDTLAHTATLLTPHPTLPGVLVDTNWSPFITGTPAWFRLLPGSNSIKVTPTGSNVVQVSWVGWDEGPKDSFTFNAKPAAPTPPTGTAGLVAVDHVYRCKMTGATLNINNYKIIPGIRRSSVDTWDAQRILVESPHIFPDETMAGHIHRMRRDPSTTTPWVAANIDSTQAIFKFSNYKFQDK